MRYPRLILASTLLALTACSSAPPNAVEPVDVPDFKATYDAHRLWERDTGHGVGDADLTLCPAPLEQSIFTVDSEGRIESLNRKTGKIQWRKDTDESVSGGLYAGYGSLVYGTRDGEVVARSTTDGKEQWRTRVSGEVLSRPASDGDMLLVQTLDGRVVALDMKTGKQKWSYEANTPVLTLRGTSTPLIEGDRVLAGFASGKVVELELSSGAPVWEQQVAEPTGRSELDRLVDVDSNLIFNGGGVFATTFQGKLAVLDFQSGHPYWDKKMSSFRNMDDANGFLYLTDDKGHVVAVDERTGSTLWRQKKMYGRKLVGTAVQDNLVVTGDFEGYLYWMDASDGHLVARARLDRDGFSCAPVVFDNVLYAYGRNGDLAAYKPKPRGSD